LAQPLARQALELAQAVPLQLQQPALSRADDRGCLGGGAQTLVLLARSPRYWQQRLPDSLFLAQAFQGAQLRWLQIPHGQLRVQCSHSAPSERLASLLSQRHVLA
jgi:hypothetical protein